MGAFETSIASILAQLISPITRTNNLGRVESEMLFLIDAEHDTQRRPDVAFVSFVKWPRSRRVPRTAAWAVVPDLAVEVVSPTNTATEVEEKLLDYFAAGVGRVWVVHPVPERLYDYLSPTHVGILTRADELDGAPQLPGFRLPLADLFPPESEEPPPT
jgi:Uma2 family endonuclease